MALGEHAGHLLCPRVGGGGVAGVADDQDVGPTGPGDRARVVFDGHRPRRARQHLVADGSAEPGGGAETVDEGLVVGQADRVGAVEARDGRVGGPVAEVVVVLRQVPQRLAVVAPVSAVQCGEELRPRFGVVGGRDGGHRELRRSDRVAGLRGAQWAGLDAGLDPVVGRRGVLEVALLRRRARGQDPVECAGHGRGLSAEQPGEASGGVDDPVEHQGADVGGEQGEVPLADVGAVAEADVVEALVAQRHAEGLEVAGGVVGPDAREELGGLGLGRAVGQGRGRGALDVGLLGGVVGVGVVGEEGTDTRAAGQPRAGANTPRVPADEVELRGDGGGERVPEQEVEPAGTGSARVDEQGPGAVARAGVHVAAHGEVDLLAGGLRPVERDGQVTTPRRGVLLAGRPLDRGRPPVGREAAGGAGRVGLAHHGGGRRGAGARRGRGGGGRGGPGGMLRHVGPELVAGAGPGQHGERDQWGDDFSVRHHRVRLGVDARFADAGTVGG